MNKIGTRVFILHPPLVFRVVVMDMPCSEESMLLEMELRISQSTASEPYFGCDPVSLDSRTRARD